MKLLMQNDIDMCVIQYSPMSYFAFSVREREEVNI